MGPNEENRQYDEDGDPIPFTDEVFDEDDYYGDTDEDERFNE